VVTAGSCPRRGAARRGHRLVGWCAGPGEPSDLSLECSVHVDEPDEFYSIGLGPCAARGPFSLISISRGCFLGWRVRYGVSKAVNIVGIAHGPIEQGSRRIICDVHKEVPGILTGKTNNPSTTAAAGVPPHTRVDAHSIHLLIQPGTPVESTRSNVPCILVSFSSVFLMSPPGPHSGGSVLL